MLSEDIYHIYNSAKIKKVQRTAVKFVMMRYC